MQEIKNILIQIHNELMKISVKGDDTIALASCLQALRQLVNNNINTGEEIMENYGCE
jgi:hypothetical protein